MATRPDFSTGHFQTYEADTAALLRTPQTSPRVLFTHLTNSELADCGLLVSRARKESVSQEQVSAGNIVPLVSVTQWLVQEASRHDRRQVDPSWLPRLVARVDSLKAMAAEEELPFSDVSANAALAFARHHGRSRQPSAFLVGNGNIRLLWLNDTQEQVGLQFRDNNDVQIVLFEQSGDRLDPITAHKRADDVMPFVERNRLTRLL